MMKHFKYTFALVCLMSAFTAQAQYYPLTPGDWDKFLTWVNSPPGSSNNVVLLIYDVTVAGTNEASNNLTVNTAIIVNGGGYLNVTGDLDLNTNGTVDINNGSVEVDGDFDYDGSVDITPSTSNSLEIHGNIYDNSNLRWQTANGGSIIIYSELDF